jgi:hypothetical protein
MLTPEEAKAVAQGALHGLDPDHRRRVKAVHLYSPGHHDGQIQVVIHLRLLPNGDDTTAHIFNVEELT